MKKTLALLLTLLLLMTSSAFAEIPGFWNPPPVNEGQYPCGDGSITLTYWMSINAGAANFITSYDENPAFIQLQENTGIDIEFIHPTVGMESEQFNLLMASGDLPDLILMDSESLYEGGLKQMYADGAIIDIAPYLEELAPQYLACINASEISQKQIMSGDNGEVFGFYRMSHAGAFPYLRMIARKDWLEEFNMSEPMTIAEYEAYFQAILDNKPGVTPLYARGLADSNSHLLMGAFDIIGDFFVKDDVVGHYANADGYKEYLQLMADWYSKGYLSKDFASLSGTEITAMFDNGTLGMYPDSVDASLVRTKEIGIPSTNLPYMRKAVDSKLHSEISSTPVDTSSPRVTVITSACENVEAAIAFLNYAYTYEGSLVANWGVEGETWVWGEDGLPKFTAQYTDNPDGMTTSNCAYVLRCHLFSKYTYADYICGLTDEQQVANRMLWYGDPNIDSALRLPPLNFSSEEISQREDLMNQVNTYIDEMALRFITGQESFDNWDTYVETVNNMGLLEAISITQTAYNRF